MGVFENLTIGVLAKAAGVNVAPGRFYHADKLLQEPDRLRRGGCNYGALRNAPSA
jgi:DNA-binding transcriptional MerR regulator